MALHMQQKMSNAVTGDVSDQVGASRFQTMLHIGQTNNMANMMMTPSPTKTPGKFSDVGDTPDFVGRVAEDSKDSLSPLVPVVEGSFSREGSPVDKPSTAKIKEPAPLEKLRVAVLGSSDEIQANEEIQEDTAQVNTAAAKSILLWKGDKETAAQERVKARERRISQGGDPEDFKQDVSTNVSTMLTKKAESAKAKVKERKYIIHPRNRHKMFWDVYCGLIILYSVLVIPFRICFNQEAVGFTYFLDFAIDFSFFLDMVMSFRTGFYTKSGHLSMNSSRIASNYLRSWFLVDFFSTVPIERIVVLFLPDIEGNNLRTIKMIRIVRLVRLMKLVKLLTRGALKDVIASVNPAVMRLITLMGVILFIAHFLACFWALVNVCTFDGGVSGPEDGELYYDLINDNIERLGLQFNFTNSTYRHHTDMLDYVTEDTSHYHLEIIEAEIWKKCGLPSNMFSQYLASFYWVIATMMAVGYGDIYGENNRERLYAIMVEIIGAGCFGFIISTTTQIVETMSPETRIRKSKMEDILEYSKWRNLPLSLHRKIRKHFEYMYSQKSVFNELGVLRQLPVNMRVQITLQMHSTKVDKLARLLKNMNENFVAEMILLLRPFFLAIGGTIGVHDSVPDQIFIVNSGYIQILGPEKGAWVIQSIMNEGSVIGLDAALSGRRLDFKMCAPIKTDMWFIETYELRSVLDFYDDERAILLADAEKTTRMEKQSWSSETVMINDVKVKKIVLVDQTPTKVENLAEHMLAGTAALAESATSSSSNKKGFIKTIKPDHSDPNATVQSLETPGDVWERKVIDPNNRYKTFWDCCVGVIIIFSVAVVPLRLGFFIEASKAWLIIDWVTDGIFFVDIVVTFRTGYLDDSMFLVTVPKMIRNKYLRFWFLIDLVSTVPIDKIVEVWFTGDGLRSLKIIRVIRLVRLLKLVKLLKIDMSGIEEVIEIDATVKKTFSLFGFLFGLAHFFGCFWNMSSLVNEGVYDGLGGKYISSLYWAFTTMTTVGYGDILALDDMGRGYATIMMIVGATLFSYIVGSASSIVTNEKGGERRKKDRIGSVYNYCVENGVSKPLENRIKRHIDYNVNQRSPFDEQGILDCLPTNLRHEVVMYVREEAIKKICIFNSTVELDRSYIACILQYLVPVSFFPCDNIYLPDEGSKGLYFVLKGKCVYTRYSPKQMQMMKDASQNPAYADGIGESMSPEPRGAPFLEGDLFGFDAGREEEASYSPSMESREAFKETKDKPTKELFLTDMILTDMKHFGAMCLEICQLYYLSNQSLAFILFRHPFIAEILLLNLKAEIIKLTERRQSAQAAPTSLADVIVKPEIVEELKKTNMIWTNENKYNNFVRRHSTAGLSEVIPNEDEDIDLDSEEKKSEITKHPSFNKGRRGSSASTVIVANALQNTTIGDTYSPNSVSKSLQVGVGSAGTPGSAITANFQSSKKIRSFGSGTSGGSAQGAEEGPTGGIHFLSKENRELFGSDVLRSTRKNLMPDPLMGVNDVSGRSSRVQHAPIARTKSFTRTSFQATNSERKSIGANLFLDDLVTEARAELNNVNEKEDDDDDDDDDDEHDEEVHNVVDEDAIL